MKLKITIDDQAFEVDVEVAEESAPTNVRYVSTGSVSVPSNAVAPAKSNGSASGERQPESEANACRSPLAGVVSEISVEVGDTVTYVQPVIILEAMKMFTTITSPCTGTVKSIDVNPGDAVKQGQLLMEFS